jgi:hypothetical protein
MLGPINGAIGDFSGAVGELAVLLGVPDAVGSRLCRIMGGISDAQQRTGEKVNT